MKIIRVTKKSKSSKFRLRFVEIMVDDADFGWLSAYDWTIRNGYAATKIGHRYQSMHRMIAGVLPKDPILVDHEDNNPYNNQRYNLRKANRFQNQQNRKTNRKNTLPKGIRQLPSGKYNVRVQAFGERNVVGTFDTLKEAIEERNRVAKQLHKEFFNPAYEIKKKEQIADGAN